MRRLTLSAGQTLEEERLLSVPYGTIGAAPLATVPVILPKTPIGPVAVAPKWGTPAAPPPKKEPTDFRWSDVDAVMTRVVMPQLTGRAVVIAPLIRRGLYYALKAGTPLSDLTKTANASVLAYLSAPLVKNLERHPDASWSWNPNSSLSPDEQWAATHPVPQTLQAEIDAATAFLASPEATIADAYGWKKKDGLRLRALVRPLTPAEEAYVKGQNAQIMVDLKAGVAEGIQQNFIKVSAQAKTLLTQLSAGQNAAVLAGQTIRKHSVGAPLRSLFDPFGRDKRKQDPATWRTVVPTTPPAFSYGQVALETTQQLDWNGWCAVLDGQIRTYNGANEKLSLDKIMGAMVEAMPQLATGNTINAQGLPFGMNFEPCPAKDAIYWQNRKNGIWLNNENTVFQKFGTLDASQYDADEAVSQAFARLAILMMEVPTDAELLPMITAGKGTEAWTVGTKLQTIVESVQGNHQVLEQFGHVSDYLSLLDEIRMSQADSDARDQFFASRAYQAAHPQYSYSASEIAWINKNASVINVFNSSGQDVPMTRQEIQNAAFLEYGPRKVVTYDNSDPPISLEEQAFIGWLQGARARYHSDPAFRNRLEGRLFQRQIPHIEPIDIADSFILNYFEGKAAVFADLGTVNPMIAGRPPQPMFGSGPLLTGAKKLQNRDYDHFTDAEKYYLDRYGIDRHNPSDLGWFSALSLIVQDIVQGLSIVAELPMKLVVTIVSAADPEAGKWIANHEPLFAAMDAAAQGKDLETVINTFGNIAGEDLRTIGPIAQMVIACIPGIGTAVGIALGAAIAIANGEPIDQVFLEAAESAIPGGTEVGDAAKVAIKATIAAVQGKDVGEAVISGLIDEIPGVGQIPAVKSAALTGLALARGQNIQSAILSGVRGALPPGAQAVWNVGATVAAGGSPGDIVKAAIAGASAVARDTGVTDAVKIPDQAMIAIGIGAKIAAGQNPRAAFIEGVGVVLQKQLGSDVPDVTKSALALAQNLAAGTDAKAAVLQFTKDAASAAGGVLASGVTSLISSAQSAVGDAAKVAGVKIAQAIAATHLEGDSKAGFDKIFGQLSAIMDTASKQGATLKEIGTTILRQQMHPELSHYFDGTIALEKAGAPGMTKLLQSLSQQKANATAQNMVNGLVPIDNVVDLAKLLGVTDLPLAFMSRIKGFPEACDAVQRAMLGDPVIQKNLTAIAKGAAAGNAEAKRAKYLLDFASASLKTPAVPVLPPVSPTPEEKLAALTAQIKKAPMRLLPSAAPVDAALQAALSRAAATDRLFQAGIRWPTPKGGFLGGMDVLVRAALTDRALISQLRR